MTVACILPIRSILSSNSLMPVFLFWVPYTASKTQLFVSINVYSKSLFSVYIQYIFKMKNESCGTFQNLCHHPHTSLFQECNYSLNTSRVFTWIIWKSISSNLVQNVTMCTRGKGMIMNLVYFTSRDLNFHFIQNVFLIDINPETGFWKKKSPGN